MFREIFFSSNSFLYFFIEVEIVFSSSFFSSSSLTFFVTTFSFMFDASTELRIHFDSF